MSQPIHPVRPEIVEQDLACRGLCLDALTLLKAAHEELLCGRYQRADAFLQKAGIVVAACRQDADALVGLTAQKGQNLAGTGAAAEPRKP